MTNKMGLLAEWIQKDCQSGQSCFAERRVAMSEFGGKFDYLNETLLVMSANSKASSAEKVEIRKKWLEEAEQAREFLNHIRSNTQNTMKSTQNLSRELSEFRTGGKQKEETDGHGGSLLSSIESQLDNLESTFKESIGKLSAELQSASAGRVRKRTRESDKRAQTQISR